jgi:UDP-2,3-diacylglucosamine hydrolase
MKKVYFASDFHLGVDARLSSTERERQIIRWLDRVREDAAALYLVGDLFDFWFEYRKVIPKGYIRLLGKLAELSDAGLPVHLFTGNHDMWIFTYFEEELGIPTHRQPITAEWYGKSFYIGHGDGLGPGDHGYKMIKKIFANKICQRLFAAIPPSIGIGMADYWSKRSRSTNPSSPRFLGPEKEWLVQFAEGELRKRYFDYFIFGHRHLPIDYLLSNQKSRYINLGEWLNYNSYAVFDGNELHLRFFENDAGILFGNRQNTIQQN